MFIARKAAAAVVALAAAVVALVAAVVARIALAARTGLVALIGLAALIGLVALAALIGLAACSPPPPATTPPPPSVVATFFPLYDFTRIVVGDTATVVSLIPGVVDLHSYEPSAADLHLVDQAEVLVMLGLEFQELEQRLLTAAGRDTVVIHAAAGTSRTRDTNERTRDTNERTRALDTHRWLSVANAQRIVSNIADGMAAAHSEYAAQYRSNAARYLAELSVLEAELDALLADCAQGTILTTHGAYRSLGDRYGFRVISIHGSEPQTEPSSGRIVELIEHARRHNITHIFYEQLVGRRTAEVIAAEIDATLLPLHPLEYASSERDTYLTLMRENGRNLATALQCQ